MTEKSGQQKDDVSSAPESGTIRDDTSGSPTPERGNNPPKETKGQPSTDQAKDDPSTAPEER